MHYPNYTDAQEPELAANLAGIVNFTDFLSVDTEVLLFKPLSLDSVELLLELEHQPYRLIQVADKGDYVTLTLNISEFKRLDANTPS